jgi:hypothetical protein
MHLMYCLKTRFLLLVILVVAFATNYSCVSVKQIPAVIDYSKSVSYNKVRINVSSRLADGNLKGYIYIIPDTQICFRVWGPLGYEIGKGKITPGKIRFYSEMENVLITDIKERMENLSGCSLDLAVLQCLLLGNVDGFVSSLNQLNTGLLNIRIAKGSRKAVLNISHNLNLSQMMVYFRYRKGQLNHILLKIKKDKTFTEVSFDFVDISYDRKICTFAF